MIYSIFLFHFRVTVTGIYRATPLRVNPRQRTVKSVYKTYIDVIHFRKADSRRLRGREEEEGDEGEGQGEGLKKTFTAERIEQLKQLSKAPDIYERLSRALGKMKIYCGCVHICACVHMKKLCKSIRTVPYNFFCSCVSSICVLGCMDDTIKSYMYIRIHVTGG